MTDGAPVIRYPYIAHASITMATVQRTAIFRLSSDLKDWVNVKFFTQIKLNKPFNTDLTKKGII